MVTNNEHLWLSLQTDMNTFSFMKELFDIQVYERVKTVYSLKDDEKYFSVRNIIFQKNLQVMFILKSNLLFSNCFNTFVIFD